MNLDNYQQAVAASLGQIKAKSVIPNLVEALKHGKISVRVYSRYIQLSLLSSDPGSNEFFGF